MQSDVCLWHKADKPTASEFVRSWGFSGHGQSGPHANVAVFASGEYLALSDQSSVVSGKAGMRVAF